MPLTPLSLPNPTQTHQPFSSTDIKRKRSLIKHSYELEKVINSFTSEKQHKGNV